MRAVVRPVALLLLALLTATVAGAQPSTPASLTGAVVTVVDGDTIHVRVDGRIEKVRYIGINAPEVRHPVKGEEPGGREAAAANRRLVEGKQVRLELDVQRRDRYGRLLAYVWVEDLMVNAELVRQGHAQVMTVPPNVRYQVLISEGASAAPSETSPRIRLRRPSRRSDPADLSGVAKPALEPR